MQYATVKDITDRMSNDLTESGLSRCESLLEDAAVIIDSYNDKASEDVKRLVSCNMVLRLLGSGSDMPIGATQGTLSALGYSESFTMGNGSAGELYLTKLDKKLLGTGRKIAFASPWEEEND